MTIVIDTNVYSNALRNLDAAKQILREAEQILVSPVVIGELLTGFRLGSQEQKNRRLLGEFLDSTRVELITISYETAEKFSFLSKELKIQGTPIPTNDLWIAASAFENGARVATSDNHFSKIPGLEVMLLKC